MPCIARGREAYGGLGMMGGAPGGEGGGGGTESGNVVSVSKEGVVCFWKSNMTLLRSVTVSETPLNQTVEPLSNRETNIHYSLI